MRYHLILLNRKTKRFNVDFRFKDKKEFKERLSSFYKKYPVLKYEYIYGVTLLTAVKKRKIV